MLNYLIFLREKNKMNKELLENCLNDCKNSFIFLTKKQSIDIKNTITKCPKHCDKIINEYFRLLSN